MVETVTPKPSAGLVYDPPTGLARFDAPSGTGPWALNQNGQWFKVTKRAPGSAIQDNVYVPPLHPSVRKSIPELTKTIPAEDRFTSAKMRAANQATLRGAWRDLFFKIAPRGSGPQGIGAGMLFDGADDDYDSEGGELYPGLLPSDPTALQLTTFWNRGYDPVYGSGKLDLSWLRVYTDSDGYQRYKAFAQHEVSDFMSRWMIAKNGYVCGGDEVIDLANRTMAEQSRRQGAQPERDYTPHWAWHITPIAQCMPKSSRRRRKAIKKAAAIAAIVVGAVFLGPMVAGAFKGAAGGAAAGGAAAGGATGAAAAGGATAAGIAAKVALATSIASGAKGVKGGAKNEVDGEVRGLIPQVLGVVNTVRTLKAVASGSVPPPPLDPNSASFTDWTAAVAQQYIAKQDGDMNTQLTAYDQQRLADEIRRVQMQAAPYNAQIPPGGYYPMPQLSQPMQQAQQVGADSTLKTVALIGIPLLVLLMKG